MRSDWLEFPLRIYIRRFIFVFRSLLTFVLMLSAAMDTTWCLLTSCLVASFMTSCLLHPARTQGDMNHGKSLGLAPDTAELLPADKRYFRFGGHSSSEVLEDEEEEESLAKEKRYVIERFG